MKNETKVIPIKDEAIKKAEQALRECNLTSHELIRMLGIVAKLYDERSEEESETFRKAFN